MMPVHSRHVRHPRKGFPPAYLIAGVAERKGHSLGAFVLGGLLVGWIFSGIVVLFSRTRSARRW
jgi:hypothetical protein